MSAPWEGSYELCGLNDTNVANLEKRLTCGRRSYSPDSKVYLDDAQSGTAYTVTLRDFEDNDFSLRDTLKQAATRQHDPGEPLETFDSKPHKASEHLTSKVRRKA
jgi:hypothetical protein